MGTQPLNQDQAAAIIANRLKNGDTVQTFGDGIVKDGTGAHGWHIRPTLNLSEEEGAIESAAQSDTTQTS